MHPTGMHSCFLVVFFLFQFNHLIYENLVSSLVCDKDKWEIYVLACTVISGGSKGGRRGRAPPPWGSKFFRFHAVFGKFWQNRMLAPPGSWRPLLGEILDLPLVILRLYAILFELETKSSAHTAGVVAHTLRAEGGKPVTASRPADPPVNPSLSSHCKVLRLQEGYLFTGTER